jgi:ABC-type multidrug transport system fused ATPase/permease subunit
MREACRYLQATSALDAISEAAVQSALERLMKVQT